jgi:hypothetical protein
MFSVLYWQSQLYARLLYWGATVSWPIHSFRICVFTIAGVTVCVCICVIILVIRLFIQELIQTFKEGSFEMTMWLRIWINDRIDVGENIIREIVDLDTAFPRWRWNCTPIIESWLSCPCFCEMRNNKVNDQDFGSLCIVYCVLKDGLLTFWREFMLCYIPAVTSFFLSKKRNRIGANSVLFHIGNKEVERFRLSYM